MRPHNPPSQLPALGLGSPRLHLHRGWTVCARALPQTAPLNFDETLTKACVVHKDRAGNVAAQMWHVKNAALLARPGDEACCVVPSLWGSSTKQAEEPLHLYRRDCPEDRHDAAPPLQLYRREEKEPSPPAAQRSASGVSASSDGTAASPSPDKRDFRQLFGGF